MADTLQATEKRYRIPFKGGLSLQQVQSLARKTRVQPASRINPELDLVAQQIGELQEVLFADASKALLLVFQGVDAAGKDSTIHKVFTHADAAGCRVTAFKEPAGEETRHDFLWRCTRHLPRFGEIGIFNRSYYESVLTERVHPEALSGPDNDNTRASDQLIAERYCSIRDYERHLARNHMVVLKFWLYVSKQRQAERLLKRIDKADKRWKFSDDDVDNREHWDDYMTAYVDAVNATSRSWAPWYVIPADHKPTLQLAVARITLRALQQMQLAYPVMDKARSAQMEAMRARLIEEMKSENE